MGPWRREGRDPCTHLALGSSRSRIGVLPGAGLALGGGSRSEDSRNPTGRRPVPICAPGSLCAPVDDLTRPLLEWVAEPSGRLWDVACGRWQHPAERHLRRDVRRPPRLLRRPRHRRRTRRPVRPPRPGLAPDRLLPSPHRRPVRSGRRGEGAHRGGRRRRGRRLPPVRRPASRRAPGPGGRAGRRHRRRLHPSARRPHRLAVRPGGQAALPPRDHLVRCRRLAVLHRGAPRPTIQDHAYEGLRGHARLRPIDRDTTVAPASPPSRHRATRPATSVSWSPPAATGRSCSATRSPARCSWTSRPGTPSATSTRTSPTGPASTWRELEGENTSGAGARFPELKFGRVLEGKGRRWWQPA